MHVCDYDLIIAGPGLVSKVQNTNNNSNTSKNEQKNVVPGNWEKVEFGSQFMSNNAFKFNYENVLEAYYLLLLVRCRWRCRCHLLLFHRTPCSKYLMKSVRRYKMLPFERVARESVHAYVCMFVHTH